MKKWHLCLVSLLLCFAMLFAGCQKEETPKLDKDNPVSITIWHYYNGMQKQTFDQIVNEFNETVGNEQGIVVTAYTQGSINDLISNVLDSINHKVGSQETPDVFAAYADTAYEVHKKGLAADISQYLSDEEKAQYVPAYIEEGSFDNNGTLQLFPIAKSTEVLVLNQTDWNKFASATGASENDLATWEGVAKTAKAYYEWTDRQTPAPNDGKAFFGRDAMANYILIGCKQLGEELFQVNDGKATIQPNKEIFRRLWDNYYVPYVNGYYTAKGRFRSDDAKTGDLIALVGSTSGSLYFPNDVTVADGSSYPIESKVLPLPNFEGTDPVAVQQGAGMMVMKSNSQKEYAATLFLKWFTEKENNLSFSAGSGYLPVKTDSNQWDAVQKMIDEGKLSLSPTVEQTLKVGMEMTKDYQLYTTKPFENGTEARTLVENAMLNKLEEDSAKVEQLVTTGLSRQEAAAQYTTDENFEQWFQKLSDDLQALQG